MPKEQVHRRCPDCKKVFTTRQGLFKHIKQGRCRSARTTTTVCTATSGRRFIPRVSKLAQRLESVTVTNVKCASPVRDCLISEGVDELHLDFPGLFQADRVLREQPLDPDQFISGLELNSNSIGLPVDTNTAVTSDSCDTNNTTLMASSNIEDSTLLEQVNPVSTVTQLSLEDEVVALEGALQGAINTFNIVAARLKVLKQQVAGAITTTPKPCASMGTVIFEGIQNPAVTMRDGTLMVSSDTGTVHIHN